MSRGKPFHHGDLKSQLIATAQAFIETEGVERLSLREIARVAGVSTAAPYRHYATKEALLADVAARGFLELSRQLAVADRPKHSRRETILRQCLAYIHFAQAKPALYRLMFGAYVKKEDYPLLKEAGDQTFSVLHGYFPASNDLSQEIGCWSLVHGLACLVIDELFDQRGIVPSTAYLKKVLTPFVELWSSAEGA